MNFTSSSLFRYSETIFACVIRNSYYWYITRALLMCIIFHLAAEFPIHTPVLHFPVHLTQNKNLMNEIENYEI